MSRCILGYFFTIQKVLANIWLFTLYHWEYNTKSNQAKLPIKIVCSDWPLFDVKAHITSSFSKGQNTSAFIDEAIT